MGQQRLQQHGGAEVVDADIAVDLIHALADADLRRQVHDFVDALHRFRHRLGVADVGVDDLDRAQHRIGHRIAAVNLVDEAVEHPDLVTFGKQSAADMAADEPRAAGNQDLHARGPFRVAVILSAS